MRVILAAVTFAAVCAAVLAPSPGVASSAALPSAATFTDPRGDVHGKDATRAQQRTVDLVSGRFHLADRTLHVTLTVAHLAAVRGNQFAEVVVREDGETDVSLSAEVGTHVVHAFDGDHFYTCRGARVHVRDETVRMSVPTSCVPQFRRPTLQGSMVLARNDGSSIAQDHARRVGPLRFRR